MALPRPRVHPDVLRSGDAATIQAAEALVKALSTPDWPENRLRPGGRMTQATLTALRAYTAVPEVRNYLTDLAQNGYRSKSRQWHYFKYKYEYNDPLISPDELDERFEAVLSDPQAMVYQKTGRWVIYSPRANRLAVVSTDGQRITVYRPDPNDLAALGAKTWLINQLIA
jgi:hypothetical protein